jgi:ribosome-binding factor A
MSSRRIQKVAEAIREVVGMAILTEVRDPRIRDVTVISVDVSGDLRFAKVNVSVMGDETRQSLSLRGLQNSAGFLQAKIAEQLDLRYTPRLTFVLDQGVKQSIAVAKILREVLPPTPRDEADEDAAEEDAADDVSPEVLPSEESPSEPPVMEHPSSDRGAQP